MFTPPRSQRLFVGVALLLGCASSPRAQPAAPTPSHDVTARCEPTRAPSPAYAALGPTFVGNVRVSREHLECVLGRALDGTAPTDNASRRELTERAETRLHAAYYDLGFLEVRVAADPSRTTGRFAIEEGERFRFGSMTVAEVDAQGRAVTALGGDSAVRQMVRAVEGDWFSRETMARDLAAIQRHYRDAGYAAVEVTPNVTLRRSAHAADLAVQIRRGPLVTVDRVELRGTTRASRETLLAGFRPLVGELYNETALDASRERLRSSGRVQRVDVSTEAVPERPDRIVLNVEVQE